METRWTEEQVAEYMRRYGKAKGKDNPAVPATDLECNSGDGFTKQDASEKVSPRFRIHVHSKRRRLTDPDATSAKWAIDGLVKGGLFPDDSAKYVQEITFSQEKSDVNETVIEVWEL